MGRPSRRGVMRSGVASRFISTYTAWGTSDQESATGVEPMAFQFQCPQGHLLEGDESQAGTPVHCPVCQMLFLIPAPLPTAPVEAPAAPPPEEPAPAAPQVAIQDPAKAPPPDIVHIPCPKGHELEVPRDMFNQEVLCPHCNTQFVLKEKNSVEYRRRQEMEQEIRDRRAGNAWLNWAIIIAVLVVLGLIVMIASGS